MVFKPHNKYDITKFGTLTLIQKLSDNNILCRCECGNTKILKNYTAYRSIKNGRSMSCGCKHHCKTHGNSNSKEYQVWVSIKQRTTNPKDKGYKDYGGRGITICDRWHDSFENFIADMGDRPKDKPTIDRIDVNGNYEPSNCRWSSWKTQSLNKRKYPCKSGTTGVCFKNDKRVKKWCAQITVDYKNICLGHFRTKKEAIVARKKAENIYHKPFLNDTKTLQTMQ